MSYDIYLWQPAEGPQESPGLTYLLLAEALQCEGLRPVPADRIKEALNRAMPGWDDGADEVSIEVELSAQHVCVSLYGSTPSSVPSLLAAVAEREGLVLFDPQATPISDRDERELDRRLAKERGSNVQDEIAALRVRAESGDAEALVDLGVRLFLGDGVAEDREEAVRYYKEAAAAGNPDALFNLANCYRQGHVVAQDPGKAIELLEAVAENDRVFAPYALGEIYARGEGVAPDRARGAELLRIALGNGHPEARSLLRELGLSDVEDTPNAGPN